MQINNHLYLYHHIPRTGGTFFITNGPNTVRDHTEQWLTHYTYVERWTDWQLSIGDTPVLKNRTRIQQNKIKLFSGHSVYCNSDQWLQGTRTKLLITTVRDPLHRVLSSFNHRHQRSMLNQDDTLFTSGNPEMNLKSKSDNHTAKDYKTLWQYYRDNPAEHNLQCKWIVKSFCKMEDRFVDLGYVPGPDVLLCGNQNADLTWPWWFNRDGGQAEWYSLAEPFIGKFWWIGNTDTLKKDVKDFYDYAGLEQREKSQRNNSKIKYWTVEEVMKQHDIQNLIDSEKHDYTLYNYCKSIPRPF